MWDYPCTRGGWSGDPKPFFPHGVGSFSGRNRNRTNLNAKPESMRVLGVSYLLKAFAVPESTE